jgi:hypothetical protein
MNEEIRIRKIALADRWIRSETGNTGPLPVSSLSELGDFSDVSLSAVRVDESSNPQND